MKKGILLSLLAVILLAVVVCAIWYINEEGKMRAGSKDSFIPYNSAVVVTINAGAELAPEIRQAFAADLKVFRRKLLVRITDTLQQQGLVKAHPYVVAARVEGKSDVAFLYVMDNKDVISRGEVTDFLNRTFAAGGEKVRKYDRHKIYTLKQGKEIAYFAVCGGIILLSDSDLYIEDGLKQFDLEEAGEGVKPHYQNLNKYFSAGAGINILLNTGAFTELTPNCWRLTSPQGKDPREALFFEAAVRRCPIIALHTEVYQLEDIFHRYTQNFPAKPGKD